MWQLGYVLGNGYSVNDTAERSKGFFGMIVDWWFKQYYCRFYDS